MNVTDVPDRRAATLAAGNGGVMLTGLVSIGLMVIAGGVFGPLNDLCNAVGAALSAVLAWRLHPWHRAGSPRQAGVALAAASAGAPVAVAGSVLVLTGRTGWYLAGLYTTGGYAAIGIWLLALNLSALRRGAWPRQTAWLGVVTGILMLAGFLAVPGILNGVDSPEDAPLMVNAGLGGALGWLVLYPIWSLSLSRALLARPLPAGSRASVSH